ncbi:MAG: hypothetical protein NTY94_22670 [Alphaproteobacteria bacterium]|jgi:hypothetical protein|nr:hypothetical protein [Alphaproteobacteria bacterium]
MIVFGTLFALNVAVALGVFGFFIIGLADGTVTISNILIWGGVMGVLFSVPMAGWLLRVRGQRRLGTALLVPMVVLAALAVALR